MVSGEGYDGGPMVGTNVEVLARIVDTRDGKVIADWTPVRAKNLTIDADAQGFVEATMTCRVHRLDSLMAVLTNVSVDNVDVGKEKL
jgi:hypothetical protein